MMYGTPHGATPTEEKKREQKKDPFDELETAFKDFEGKRTKIKEILEKMGFKVEDMYMRRDEAEKLIQEMRKQAEEEALDDIGE